jgi:curli biogenesis system outer membrane secretion channel CsgG
MKLEQATFQLKKRRSWIKIVERRSLETVRDEQHLQASGRVADDSAMHVGKWLGADSLVIFRIDRPRWRDRLLARFYEQMAPVVVSSKIISVETGEVLYHDVVQIVPVSPLGKWEHYGSDTELQSAVRISLDQAVSLAIAHLDQSFR